MKTLLLTPAILILAASSLNGAVLAKYMGSEVPAYTGTFNGTLADQYKVSYASATGVTAAPLSAYNVVDGSIGTVFYRSTFSQIIPDTTSSGNLSAWLVAKMQTRTTRDSTTSYFQFNLTADPGNAIVLTNMTFDWQAVNTNAGTTTIFYYDVYVSVNGGAYELVTATAPAKTVVQANGIYPGAATQETVSFSAINFTDAENVSIRLTPWADTSQNGNINQYFKNVAINGDATPAIPEPSTYALAGGMIALGVALAVRRRRKS